MASPKAVGRFYVETTRQAAEDSASAQKAALHYMDELSEIGRAYASIWTGAQQLSLQSAFQLQNSAIAASRTLWDASAAATLSLYDEWAKTAEDGQSAILKLAAVNASLFERPAPKGAR